MRAIRIRQFLFRTSLPVATLALAAATILAAPQAPEAKHPLAVFEPFAGFWKIDRPPHDGISDEYHVVEWDLNRTILVLSEYQRKDGKFRRYAIGMMGWNPLAQRIELQEHADWGNFNRGEVEVLAPGRIRRHLFVHYAAGAALHWRETWELQSDTRYTTVIEKLENGGWKSVGKPFTSVRVQSLPKE